MAQKLEAQGNKAGVDKWDDGSDHDNVTKIHVRAEPQGIHYIQFHYVKGGKPEFGLFHRDSNPGVTQTFEINHLKGEELVSVEGYYDASSKVILGLQFKTNWRISELIGYAKNGTKFQLAVEGKKITGFHGSTDSHLNSLGAYFTKFSPSKSVAKGGKGGQEWDDGADHEGITKIEVRGGGSTGIQYIKVDYVKDGKQIYGSTHGVMGEGFTEEFEIDHFKNEYLVSVEGYYDESGIIQGLQFQTNLKPPVLIGDDTGRKFRLANNGEKIIGFHGFAENNLNSLGAYFTTSPSPFTKSESHGDSTWGDLWDDGTFKGIRKVYVHYMVDYVPGVRFHYDNGGKVETYEHGFMLGEVGEFEIDYPNEFITSVEATTYTTDHTWFRSLTFKTSTGRTSPTFGSPSDNKFVLENNGRPLVGFFGRANSREIYALGAYFAPLPPSPDAKKVEPIGGNGGASWDDGGFDDIRNIYIGHSKMGIEFIKFLYDKEKRVVVGDDHGSKTVRGVDEFKLNYSSEYLISVEGSYDKTTGVISMLRFKTNIGTSQVFGIKTGESFVLEKEGHKITGFYGKVSNMLHQIGIHVLPIAE